MTPEQVRAIIDQALSRGVDLSLSVYLVLLVITVIGGVLTPLATSYLSERGKNLATKQDLNAILDRLNQTTRVTEDIKAEISGGLWLGQQQWNYRREVYERLLSCLADQQRLIGMMQAQRLLSDGGDLGASRRIADRIDQIGDSGVAMNRNSVLAGAVLPVDVRQSLEALVAKWNEMGTGLLGMERLNALHDATTEAISAITAVARADLLAIPARAGDKPRGT